jgi:hypothetical protein
MSRQKCEKLKLFRYAVPIIKRRELLENQYKPYESTRRGVVFTN